MQPVVVRLANPSITTLDSGRTDYSDAFEVRTGNPDPRSAEQLARDALEHAPRLVRSVVLVVHRHVLRFALGPMNSVDHVLGWRVRSADADTIELVADGPLMAGLLVGRKTAPTAVRLETFLTFHERSAARIWSLVGPLHRRIAPVLLKRAVTSE